MRYKNKENPISLKYMPKNPKISEHLDEDNISYNDSEEKGDNIKTFENKNNNKAKNSRVYFYCPYNQSYTKFQNYKIEKICGLIKKYQLENYFIIQIDDDNLLYEEILKMQFINEYQIINKMFDLKLDYSFSPFQDSLFFNMSILTDFFYDQIEKYLIQIFFHNHGIYIINKDSCESIHQILMEKFIFYYVDNSEFFEKSIIDKNNKYKRTKCLINDFKIKNIISKFQEGDHLKTRRKNGSKSRNVGNSNKINRKYGSTREGINSSHYNKYRKRRNSTSDFPINFNKQNRNANNNKKDQIRLPKNKSFNNLNENYASNCKKNENELSRFNSNSNNPKKNYEKMNSLNQNINEIIDEMILKENHSQIPFNNRRLYGFFNDPNEESNENSKFENQNKTIINNNENFNMKNSLNYSDIKNRENSHFFKNNLNGNFNDKDNSGNLDNDKLIDISNKKKSISDKSYNNELENLNKKLTYGISEKENNLGAYKSSEKRWINDLNKKIIDKSKESRLSSSFSKIKRDVEKNNEYCKNKNSKSNLERSEMRFNVRKDLRERDIDSENEKSLSREKLEVNSKKGNLLNDSNSKNSDENMKLIKIFSLNEDYEKKKVIDSCKNSDENEKERLSNKLKYEIKLVNKPNNIRRFSDIRSHNFDLIDDFKDYEEYLKLMLNSKYKSQMNLENYSREVLDLRKKLNEVTTDNNDFDNHRSKLNKKEFNKNHTNENDSLNFCNNNKKNYNESIVINSINERDYKNSEENKLFLNPIEYETNTNKNDLILIRDNLESDGFNKKKTFSKVVKKTSSGRNQYKRINFSTDELIYYLFICSLEKLEEFTESLVKEADSLKGIYLELSVKERKDFFRRIHSMEVSMHIIHQETKIKKKFFKYAKNQFRTYNKLSNDFYFKNNFNFFLELMISKITQIEITFDTLENFLKMIKDNYLIIIEDNTEKENVKLNYVMKVLTILTTIYAPMNIIPGLFGMNVKVPWEGSDHNSTDPFVYICFLLAFFIIIQLYVLKKLRWL